MIGKVNKRQDLRFRFEQDFLKRSGLRDAAEGADFFAPEMFGRQDAAAGSDQLPETVNGAEDGNAGGVRDPRDPGGRRSGFVGARQHDAVRAPETLRGFAQFAARQQAPVAQRPFRVQQNDVDVPKNLPVLKCVITDQHVGVESFDS